AAQVAAYFLGKIPASFAPQIDTLTRIQGDFGTSVLQEIPVHNSRFNAQDLDLGKWNQNSNPDIAQSTVLPHVTVNATGDGDVDYYKFAVTAPMLQAAAAQGGVSAIFDVDHGYEPGDPIFWASRIQIFNEAGDLLAAGPGFSNPAQGGTGSTTWLDDYL